MAAGRCLCAFISAVSQLLSQHHTLAGPSKRWHTIKGASFAYAVDGRGHHDGHGIYSLTVPVADFGIDVPRLADRRRSAYTHRAAAELRMGCRGVLMSVRCRLYVAACARSQRCHRCIGGTGCVCMHRGRRLRYVVARSRENLGTASWSERTTLGENYPSAGRELPGSPRGSPGDYHSR